MSGLEAALNHSKKDYILLLACDMPLIPGNLLLYLYESALNNRETDITAPYIRNRPEPLCAVYKRDLLPKVTQAIQNKQFRIIKFIQERGYLPVTPENIKKETTTEDIQILFKSANTPEILKELEKISKERLTGT